LRTLSESCEKATVLCSPLDLFDTCTQFEVRSFVEDQLARIKMKEFAEEAVGQ